MVEEEEGIYVATTGGVWFLTCQLLKCQFPNSNSKSASFSDQN